MDKHFLRGGILMSVKIEWEIFTAETQSDGTWRSNSPTLAELLNVIASPERIKEPTLDIEYSITHLAVKGLPYFKITKVTSEMPGQKPSRDIYTKTTNSKARYV